MRIDFPDNLPVTSRIQEIEAAIASHAVIIVCGETGSGKTTQLPKIALAIGRAAPIKSGERSRLIAHTQPRRMAATSVAKRIAEELQSPLGAVVGYKVRFQDRLLPSARIKLMTDGILLAEAQSDPLLRAYDTIIIDEAHERSLNIDFLLGHLRHILPQRPDLKIIITSATIDAERFAQHFASQNGPAPIITVSGRTYPVEQRWRPFEESREYSINDAIYESVQELWRGGQGGDGDILVFLPGEREIRDAADHLRRHLATQAVLRNTEILPLFARLSQSDQEKVFATNHSRRIVLATNVAETSLTVPGIRYVIDTGLARVKRYSYRNKVEQLQIEPISQAAANQRAGRCGRVANGICIRLYSEEDFTSRTPFTDPEILRSSLASVILRMKSLGLGHIDDFPFIEPPARKAIADGYALLQELGAMDESYSLTPLGSELAKLPLDPRIGRMILAARQYQCLHEVLIIASALGTQDVRDRPHDRQAAADEKHRLFSDEKSEFVGLLKLWDWIESVRGKNGSEHESPTHKLSQRQQEARLREHFIHPRRVREWRDVHTQLYTVVSEHGWRINTAPASYEQIHKAMLSGLLGNVGYKLDNEDMYLGARGIKFVPHPGAHLSKKPGRWLVAAELVETTRLFGRSLATIDPQWLPELAGHIIKTQLLEPHWERKVNEVVALERATLYGLVIYNNKRVNYGRIDLMAAREIFIREALVNNDVPPDWEHRFAFFAHNQKMIRSVEQLEHQSRRQDVLVDDELIYAFYAKHLGHDVCGGPSLERWYRHTTRTTPDILKFQREELMRHEASGVTSQAFPKLIRLGGIDCAASYLHQPGDTQDGVTVTIPIYALNQVQEARCEWLVPGMLQDKVLALLKSLHAKVRSRLVPLPAFAAEFSSSTPFAQEPLLHALIAAIRAKTQLTVMANDFKLEQLPPHLFMNLHIVDEYGRQLGMGRHLAKLKADLSTQARNAFAVLASITAKTSPDASPNASHPSNDSTLPAASSTSTTNKPMATVANTRYTEWTFGELPELMEIHKAGQTLVGFPALVDHNTHVEIEVFDEPDNAAQVHKGGLRRLLALQLREPIKYLEKQLPDWQKIAVLYMPLGTDQELRQQIIELALERAFLQSPLPQNSAEFTQRIQEGRTRLNLIAQEVARMALAVLTEYAAATRKLKDTRPPREQQEDIHGQISRLLKKHFLRHTPWEQLQHLPRYLRAIVLRLDKYKSDPMRDTQRLAEIRPLEQRWIKRLAQNQGAIDTRLNSFKWLLEELRVSLFAQELRTPQPVSVKRLEKSWIQLTS